MYGAIKIPSDAVMLYNVLRLKKGVNWDEVELAIGEMCSVVSQTYGNEQGGFIAGQVIKFSGFVAPEGSLHSSDSPEKHIALLTYWRSFEDHARSHLDKKFTEKFDSVGEYCESTHEIGYELLWQGSAPSAIHNTS